MIRKKKEPTKDIWFFLYPYVFMDVKNGKAIIYNTLNGVLLEYDTPVIIKILDTLYKSESSIVNILEFSDDAFVDTMIRSVRNSFSGDIVMKPKVNCKPFQFKPTLFFDNSFEYDYKSYMIPVLNSERPEHYLEELSIYINNQCVQQCQNCNIYYKQTYFCTSENSHEMYSFDDLIHLLLQAEKTSIKRVNLLGGNIFQYPYILELISYLNNYPANIYYYINHLNFTGSSWRFIDLINNRKDMFVFLIPPLIIEKQPQIMQNIYDLREHFFTFLVSCEKDFNDAVTVIEKIHLIILPLFLSL